MSAQHEIVRVVQHATHKDRARIYARGRMCPSRQYLTPTERFQLGNVKDTYWMAIRHAWGFELLHITDAPAEWW